MPLLRLELDLLRSVAMDLKGFGEKLTELRAAAGLSRDGLLEKLDLLSARAGRGPLSLDAQLLWKWETAFTHKGRRWKPQRPHLLDLIEVFADQLTLEKARQWAAEAGYQLGPHELAPFFPPDLDWPPAQVPPLPAFYINRATLEADILAHLNQGLQCLVLFGPGGAGKTTLAARLTRLLDYPDGLIFLPVQPGDTVEDILKSIAADLGLTLSETSPARQVRHIQSRLSKKRCLIVLDDLPALPNLEYLRLSSETSRVLCTTRDRKVADLLEAALFPVNGMTEVESLQFVANWANDTVRAKELVRRLGGWPLALKLCRAQLEEGVPLEDLLAAFRQKAVDLNVLDLDEPRTRHESLSLCFEVSYQLLPVETRRHFAQLGYFTGRKISEAAIRAVWGVSRLEAQKSLKKLLRFALLERSGPDYQLHLLLQDYARQKLYPAGEHERAIRHRHAAWYIRYALYHPGILADHTAEAPDLEQSWADTVAGVKWSSRHAPELAARAALLAYTERPALLEEIGRPLLEAVETYLARLADAEEQAIFHEVAGDLYLLQADFLTGLEHFNQAGMLWQKMGHYLAGSKACLRLAGVHLLRQDLAAAAEVTRQAQALLQLCVPLTPADLDVALTLFFWFDMVYNPLVRWASLPEEDIISLTQLAGQTNQPLLIARSLHIYRLWCTVKNPPRPAEIRQQGRELALRAYELWRANGRMDRADDEISFTRYQLTNRYSRRTAVRFARRRSRTTPKVSPSQIRLIKSGAVRWWLQATETQRIDWLSWMLPRYLGAVNRPQRPNGGTRLSPLNANSRAYRWVEDILNVGALGGMGRRLTIENNPPFHPLLNGPEWRVLSGQRTLALEGSAAKKLIDGYISALEAELRDY